jgi:hypothetical protein
MILNYALMALVILLTQYPAEARGPLIWQEEFDALNTSRWKYLITGWRGGNSEFQYYADYPENRLNTADKS